MTKYSKFEAMGKIEQLGIMPLFYHHDKEVCQSVARAVFSAGMDVIEFTNRGDGALDAFSSIVELGRAEYPNALVGIGSVNDAYVASQFIMRGANFIVAPGFDETTARLCNRHKILYIPACSTVTEIMAATELGVDLIKLFPADALGGFNFLKALKGPLPWLKAVATGGISNDPESLTQWFAAGVSALGMGSNLISREILEKLDWVALQAKLESIVALVQNIKIANR